MYKRLTIIPIISVVIGLVGLVFSVYQTRAANLTPGPLEINYSGESLFSEKNIEPGDVIVKDVSVRNTGVLPHSFSISVNGVSGNLANVIRIEPRENGVPIWNQTLSSLGSLSSQSKIVLASIDPGATRNLQFAAIFPAESGNEFQGQSSANFNFVFGNESTDQRESTSFSSPAIQSLGQDISSAITYNPPSDSSISTEDSDQSGEAKGAETRVKELCFWWLVVLAFLIIGLVAYNRYQKKVGKIAAWWIWPLVFAAVLYFVHYFLEKGYQQTIFCHWFWAVEAVVLIIYYIFDLGTKED